MAQEKTTGIAYKPLPPELQVVEREKARLLLEAHTLKAQARFTEAAERFAQAAHQEEQLADWAARQELSDLHYLHAFSALSCWAQAGDPHRAWQMSHALLTAAPLTTRQRKQLELSYLHHLSNSYVLVTGCRSGKSVISVRSAWLTAAESGK